VNKKHKNPFLSSSLPINCWLELQRNQSVGAAKKSTNNEKNPDDLHRGIGVG